jgi:hypothetical protein
MSSGGRCSPTPSATPNSGLDDIGAQDRIGHQYAKPVSPRWLRPRPA